MRNLLHALDRDRLVAHLRNALLRDLVVGERRLIALAEGASMTGGSFCAAPANALAAELLAQPEIRDADPAFADGILDFVMAMADAPLPCRRAAAGGIEVLRENLGDFEILTPFHRFTGDLSAGVVRQEPRDGSQPPAEVMHTGNLVEFRLDRHRNGVDAENTITHFTLRRTTDGIVLMHESRIMGTAGWLRPRQVEAGTLRYQYEILAGSPLLRLSVTFTAAPRRRIRHLRLTTAVDQLGGGGTAIAEAMVGTGPAGAMAWRDIGVPKLPGLSVWSDGKPVPHVALGRTGWPAQAPVLHVRPAAADGVMSVKAVAQRAGALHWVILRHGPHALAGGASVEVREDRLLTTGGAPDAVASAMALAARAGDSVLGLDLEAMPPSGAALNAVATQLLMTAHGAYRSPPTPARVAALEAWFDREFAALMAGQAKPVDLGHAMLATEARLRAGSSVEPFGPLLQQVLALQVPDGRFQGRGEPPAPLADHAVMLLALARAVPYFEPAVLAGPIARALAAVQPGTVTLAEGVRSSTVEALALVGGGAMPQQDYALAIGLMARALGAVLLADEVRPGTVPADALAHAQALHRQALALLRPLVRPAGAALEVASSPLGGSANPAGQAALVLGLMAPDATILRLVPVAA
ncbi:hypothetical protein ACLF3G_05910 [Falsiroseomonas sp. HC035]|uniref:hypothetical protein n=1 Tax=Falsiroseomonas sp. HC035 TaxID=3390999 RepID=UPI003D30F32C